MKQLKLYNKTTDELLTEQCFLANTFGSRYKGLIGKKEIPEDYALIIKPCNQIHMFFMKFAIDVVYVDSNHQVCGIDVDLKPWRIGKKRSKARMVIEFGSGFANNRIHLNDVLVFEEFENSY